MRENRTYGSEGGEGHNPSRPLSQEKWRVQSDVASPRDKTFP